MSDACTGVGQRTTRDHKEKLQADLMIFQDGPQHPSRLGGGVPAGPFIETYHFPVVGLSLVNYDDNQHTDNENLRLGNLWDGIRSLAAILSQP